MCEYEAGQGVQRARHLSSVAARLHELSHKYAVPVVAVNQVIPLSRGIGRSYRNVRASSRLFVVIPNFTLLLILALKLKLYYVSCNPIK